MPPGCSSRHIKQDLDSRTLRGVLVLGGDEVPFALLLSLFAATILGAALYAVHPPRDHAAAASPPEAQLSSLFTGLSLDQTSRGPPSARPESAVEIGAAVESFGEDLDRRFGVVLHEADDASSSLAAAPDSVVGLSQPPSPVARRRGRVGRESACIPQPIAVDIQESAQSAVRRSGQMTTGRRGPDVRHHSTCLEEKRGGEKGEETLLSPRLQNESLVSTVEWVSEPARQSGAGRKSRKALPP